MKKFLRLAFGLAVLAALAYGIYASPMLRIHSVEFNSQYGLDLDTIELYTGLSEGDFFFDVSEETVGDGLLEHPFVKKATVTKRFPNSVSIELEYREHFCVVKYLGVLISIDDEMVVLGVMSESDKGYVVEGLPLDSYSAGRVIKITKLYVLQNVINYIKLFKIAALNPEYTVRFEDNCIYFKIDGITVNFGLGENYERRFNDFLVIYNDLKKNSVDRGTIDISSDGLPVYRPFED